MSLFKIYLLSLSFCFSVQAISAENFLAPETSFDIYQKMDDLTQEIRVAHQWLEENASNFLHSREIEELRQHILSINNQVLLDWTRLNYSRDGRRLLIPIDFVANKQRYINVYHNYRGPPIMHDSSKTLHQTPLNNQYTLQIIEEDRTTYYHGTWLGYLILSARKNGHKGRSVTGQIGRAWRYTDLDSRNVIRNMVSEDDGYPTQTLEQLLATLNRNNIHLFDMEGNPTLGESIILSYWADLITQKFIPKKNEINQPEIVLREAASLNTLTTQSKQELINSLGLTHPLPWMDPSWNGMQWTLEPGIFYTSRYSFEIAA